MRAGGAPPSIARAVMRYLLLSLLVVLAGCSKDAGAGANSPADNGAKASVPAGNAPAGKQADALDDSDCNLQTVLDPNKAGSPGHLIKSERNPNGDSELAVLMRLLVDGLRDARLLAEAGEKVQPLFPVHRAMRCAWPTKPEDRNEGFDARAQAYLATVQAFDGAPSKESYNAIITSCVSCHQVSCGGVIEFIESLRWE